MMHGVVGPLGPGEASGGYRPASGFQVRVSGGPSESFDALADTEVARTPPVAAPASTPDVDAVARIEADWIAAALLPAGWRAAPSSHDPAVSSSASKGSFSRVTHVGTILTVEYHPAQRALHLLVADSLGTARLAMFYKDRLGALLKELVDHQEVIAMDRLVVRLKPLVAVCPQTWWVGPRGGLVRLSA